MSLTVGLSQAGDPRDRLPADPSLLGALSPLPRYITSTLSATPAVETTPLRSSWYRDPDSAVGGMTPCCLADPRLLAELICMLC